MSIPNCYDPVYQAEQREAEWDRFVEKLPACTLCKRNLFPGQKFHTACHLIVCASCLAYINRGVFNKVVQDAGYSYAATLSYLKANSLIETRGRAFTKSKRINGVRSECVVLKLQTEWDDECDSNDLLPM